LFAKKKYGQEEACPPDNKFLSRGSRVLLEQPRLRFITNFPTTVNNSALSYFIKLYRITICPPGKNVGRQRYALLILCPSLWKV
jgi:hypothetical protein